MQAHPAFANVWLHSDDELAEALGADIVERETIHEWPLSCVQRLRLADGRRLVYKSQLPPTVEAAFYARATSPLLPAHRLLGMLGACETMVIEWIDAPLLRDAAERGPALVEHGRRVVAAIGEIGGDVPVYLDIGSRAAWVAFVDVTLARLNALVRDRRFRAMDGETIVRLRAWADSAAVHVTIVNRPRVTHGDLKADQVFVVPDGYRVIDWQRPIVAPPDIDLAALLVSREVDPRSVVDGIVVGIFWFLRLSWAVEAQFERFPDFRGPLFESWARDAVAGIFDTRLAWEDK